ncbi:MAG: undecaprenyl-diphosphate phosphatase [Acholeplasmataceae bacterium]
MERFIEILKYIILGIIQGITEIFPVSSSGHLTIFSRFLGMDLSNLTIFLMITNTGSFLALLFFFRNDIKNLITGTWKYITKGNQAFKEDFFYILKLLIAVIPIGIVGLLIKDYLPNDLLTVGFSLIITGALLFYVYHTRNTKWQQDITWKNALIIGAFQAFGVLPGISRSGITMIGGLTQKIELKKILKFSFLSYIIVSVPVMILGFYEAYHASESIDYVGYGLAFIMSFIFSLISVKLLYQYVKVKNLIVFSIYCVIVGALCIILNIWVF